MSKKFLILYISCPIIVYLALSILKVFISLIDYFPLDRDLDFIVVYLSTIMFIYKALHLKFKTKT